MRSGCAPPVCEDAARPILPWLALAIGLAAIGHLAWEAAQLPLYTLWSTGTPRAIGFALVHCTGGDVLITTATFSAAAMLARHWRWPAFGWRMALAAILLGAAYTILSEWLNVEIRRTWSYAGAMPVVPWLGTGLVPLLQWLIVPSHHRPAIRPRNPAITLIGARLHLRTASCYAGFRFCPTFRGSVIVP